MDRPQGNIHSRMDFGVVNFELSTWKKSTMGKALGTAIHLTGHLVALE
jgi:hypothetical protein